MYYLYTSVVRVLFLPNASLKKQSKIHDCAINMVRLKNRYMLVNILYPDSSGKVASSKVPDLISFNQPTTDDLTPNLLVKAIRAQVAELFGDYGSGAIADSLTGKLVHSYEGRDPDLGMQ
jgi:RNase P/RNase MRP subunit POP5